MNPFQSTNAIKEYPDKSVPVGKERHLTIENHWNKDDRVVLRLDGKEFVALADDLQRAIKNAVNAHR